jgi:hypothetical protein
MMALKMTILWFLIKFTYFIVVKINKEEQTHQVVFKRIDNYATDAHYHHIRILVNLSKIIYTLVKAMETIETHIKNMYHQSLMYYKDHHSGKI